MQNSRDYRNFRGALGFSFRYYLTSMGDPGGIRLLEIDGVAPTAGNVRDGSYPFTVPFYAVTAVKSPDAVTGRDLNARRLVDWILSWEGQLLVERTGYVPL
jgi:phosphate transport system substrate-binding protein